MESALTVHCEWEDERVREMTGHPSSYAVAKKLKMIILHAHDCLRASRGYRDNIAFI